MSEPQFMPSGLVVIERDATGHIITRLTCTRSWNVVSAMKSACSVLQLKEGAIRVEIHANEDPTSTYPGTPLATISPDYLALTPDQTSEKTKGTCSLPNSFWYVR